METKKSLDYYDYYNNKDYALKRFKKLSNSNYRKFYAHFYNRVSVKKEMKVLDVGCGVGYFTNLVELKGAKGFGIDISKECIKLAKENFKGEFLEGDITKLPYENNFFDVIHCDEVIEHLSLNEARLMVNEMQRVLKKGGRIYVKTPNKEATGYRWLLQKFKGQQKIKKNDTHIFEYTKRELYNMFNKFGINYIKQETYIPNKGVLGVFLGSFFSFPILRKWFGIKLFMEAKKINELDDVEKILNT
ncbi:class I SAM-dependent methyltransferase [Candidatus Woesearchaeota archaeon]|nr:class I SAM-dependent methyltransferase [Candidatus Woesearchaeota archaeon]MBT4322104.1 class I SAM-dependent methyltransferase [Candidatus Woesearchaeota archaeon]MBT4630681.1 class I SAM-dependent methyltransferase [Candidatus Woesearchaeota archaeon]